MPIVLSTSDFFLRYRHYGLVLWAIGLLQGLTACQDNPDVSSSQPIPNTQIETPYLQNLSQITQNNPPHITIMTDLSNEISLPINIIASENNDNSLVIELANIGHTAESIAITNTMIQQMAQSMHDPNPDIAFAKSMIAHHQGAIALAKVYLNYGKNDSLKRLAEDIITSQTNETIWLSNWLSHYPSASSPTPTNQTSHEYAKGMKEMYLQMIDAVKHPNPDFAFAQSLIPHHKGALALSQVVLRYGHHDKIRQVADNIIVSQQHEIKFLQQWLIDNKTLAK